MLWVLLVSTFGTYTVTGIASDRIDALLHRSHGEILSPAGPRGPRGAGEYDYVREGHVTRRDVRRLVAAGLMGKGLRADVLADRCEWAGDAASFVEFWVSECLAGLDDRADHRAGTAWENRERPEDSYPADTVDAYLRRLVFTEKRDYATAYAAHVVDGHECPTDPGTDWARKARRRVDKLTREQVAA